MTNFRKFLWMLSLGVATAFNSVPLSAQLVAINSASFPGLPATSCTNTFVDVSVTLGCINTIYNGASVTVTGNTINVNLDYSLGPICLPTIVTNTENINLGMLAPGSYSVVANGILNGANASSVTTSLTVNSCCSAIPAFAASNDTVCPGDSVYFTNTSTGATSQAWYVNNNQVSTGTNYGQVFSNTGTYDIKLVVSATSCSDSMMEKLYVINSSTCCPANPGFTSSSPFGCAGDSIYFTNTSTGATQYTWYVGNNMVSSGTDYGQVFNAAGTYTISLVAGDGSCTDSISQSIQITDPFVDLGPDTMICKEATILLVAGFQFDSIFWSDGSRGATLNTGPGTYYVDVYKNGCPASDTVVVGEVPVVPANLGSDTILCVGDSIVFDVTRTGAAYQWQDNSQGSVFTVTDSGTYWVLITEPSGCTTSDTIKVSLDSCNSNLGHLDVSGFDLFPQPASKLVSVSLPMAWDEVAELLVFDLTGKILLHMDLGSWSGKVELDLTSIPEGTYIVELRGEVHRARNKLVIRR